jgi:hypothetical protein
MKYLELCKGAVNGKVLDKGFQLFSQKFWNWDVKIIQEIRRKDSDKMVQMFHELVS